VFFAIEQRVRLLWGALLDVPFVGSASPSEALLAAKGGWMVELTSGDLSFVSEWGLRAESLKSKNRKSQIFFTPSKVQHLVKFRGWTQANVGVSRTV